MAWEIRKIYYYLVCFAALIMLVIGAVQVVQGVLDLLMPEDAYRPTAVEMRMRYDRPDVAADTFYTEAELQAMADQETERMERSNRRRIVRSLIGNLALLLIAAPLYLYHWRQVRKLDA